VNAAEALAITRFVKAACTGQKFDEYTADVWAELLADVAFTDARAAVSKLGKLIPFIGPPEIIAEVKRIRAERLQRFGNSEPEYDGDDVREGLRAVREFRRRIADGDTPPAEPRPNIEGQQRVQRMIEGRCELPADVRHAFSQAEQAAKRKRADAQAATELARAERRARIEAAQAELDARDESA
jgi:hypothetical protein